MLVSAARLVTPARTVAPGWLRVDGDRITDVGTGAAPGPADLALPDDAVLAPGFVDVHVHGGGGASFDGGDPVAAATVARAHLVHGTTSIAASLVTGSRQEMTRSIRALAELVTDGVLAGIHLEGPFLSARYAGAHDRGLLAVPDRAAVGALLAAGDGAVRMVTLAPELDGGIEAVRALVADGVVAAVGHTEASYDVVRAAVEAGASMGTHLFNAMPSLHHREPGPVAALLESDAHVELISDGVHLHPAMLRFAARAKPGRSVLVTDAMAAAAGADGDYRLGTMEVEVRDGVARLAGGGTIAGSTLTMDAAVRHAVHDAGLDLADAVHAASTAPAAALGLADVGALEAGRRADLVVLDAALRVIRVMRAGLWVPAV